MDDENAIEGEEPVGAVEAFAIVQDGLFNKLIKVGEGRRLSDGSISVRLDAAPASGRLVIRAVGAQDRWQRLY